MSQAHEKMAEYNIIAYIYSAIFSKKLALPLLSFYPFLAFILRLFDYRNPFQVSSFAFEPKKSHKPLPNHWHSENLMGVFELISMDNLSSTITSNRRFLSLNLM